MTHTDDKTSGVGTPAVTGQGTALTNEDGKTRESTAGGESYESDTTSLICKATGTNNYAKTEVSTKATDEHTAAEIERTAKKKK